MRVRTEQLGARLRKSLDPVYLVYGDEPLQQGEAADAVRAAARGKGYGERVVFHAEPGFDWQLLASASRSLSLFTDKQLIDLHVFNGKIGSEGAAVLKAFAQNPPGDVLLLINAGKLDASTVGGGWFKAVEKAGVVVQAKSVDARQLPGWLEQRMRMRDLEPQPGVTEMLAERVEGNLLAAWQEIEKLLLLNGPGSVSREHLVSTVADSARFDVFDLVDSALAASCGRAWRILDGLRAEGESPALVLWALAREIRVLAAMSFDIERGLSPDSVLNSKHVWASRVTLLRAVLRRLSRPRLQALLEHCALTDRVIKGQEQGDAWDELLWLTSGLAGVDFKYPQ